MQQMKAGENSVRKRNDEPQDLIDERQQAAVHQLKGYIHQSRFLSFEIEVT